MTKFFFGVVLIIFSSLLATAQEETVQDLPWYQSFFVESDPKAIEQRTKDVLIHWQEAVDSHDLKREAFFGKELGLMHLIGSRDYEKAMDLFIRSLSIEDSLKLKKEPVFTYLAIAQLFEETGNLKKADEALDQALNLNVPVNDKEILVFIYNKQGSIKARDGQIEAAEENYNAVLMNLVDLPDPSTEAEAHFNLGTLYTRQNKLDKALEKYKQSLSLRRSEKDAVNEANTLNAIGNLYFLMKNDEKSLANHVVALEIRQRLGDKAAIAESYNNIGALYYQQKNIERAVANVDLALAAAQASQDQEQMRKSYDLLSLCLRDAGDFQKALRYRELFVEMTDFIQRDMNQQKLVDAQTSYLIDKKQTEIHKLESIRKARERELAAERRTKIILYALVGLAAVVLVLILYLYFLKRRTNKILQVAHDTVRDQNIQLTDLNATKDKFFSIISHDLKGPLNSLTSFSGLLINHTDSLSKDEIKMLAKDLDKSLKNLFALLENLLEWSRSQTGNIEFKPERFDLTSLLQQNKELLNTQAQNKNISLVFNPDSTLSVDAHRHSVNTVVRNLISNAIKFTPQGGTITLSTEVKENLLVVSVKDTGVGMPKEVLDKLFRIDTKHTTKGTADEKGTGLGLILCKDFIEKNGGRIWVTSEVGKGSIFSFQLPYQATAVTQKIAV
jgi:signal transduction histidine kinase/Tfp pilus assembly protein PilF